MQLLQELLVIKNKELDSLFEGVDFDLFENLGNLNLINRKFLSVLRKQYDKKDLKDKLGQNSKVEEKSQAHQNEIWNSLSDPNATAVVLKVGDKQAMAVAKDKGYKGSTTYTMVVDGDLFNGKLGIFKDEKDYHDVMGLADKERNYGDFSVYRLTSGTENSNAGKVKKLIKNILARAKEAGNEVKTLTVMNDEERSKKSGERAEARSGAEPPHSKKEHTRNKISTGRGSYQSLSKIKQVWNRELRRDLSDRLERYKAENADSVEDQAAMLKKIITDGYMDKIKVGGMTYKLSNDRLYFRELQSRAKGIKEGSLWNDIPRIEYEFDSAGKEAEELQKKLSELRKNKPDDYFEQRQKLLPPRHMKVLLKLQGGSIVPYEIEASEDKASLY